MNGTQIEAIALDNAAKLLVDHQLWVDAKYFATDLIDVTLTHEEKTAKLHKDLSFIFTDINPFIINIISQLAILFVTQSAAAIAQKA